MPIISIIVPVYNVEKYLKRCIESILNQTFKNFELLLLDDGSTDSSGSICDKYAKKDNRIIVKHKKNQGVSATRNLGIDIAKGEYITFVDSDDWIENDYLEKMYLKINEMNVPLLITGHIEERNGIVKNTFILDRERIYTRTDIQLEFLKQEKFMWTVGDKIYNLKLIKNFRFDTELKIAEDMYFLWNVLKIINKVGYIPLYKYHYDKSASSTTSTPFSLKWMDSLKVKKKIYEDCKNISKKHKILSKMVYIGELSGLAKKAILSPKYNTKRLILYLQYYIRKNFLYCIFYPESRVMTFRQRLGIMYFLLPYKMCLKFKSFLK
ncbi:glycosyltransferase family 2 protein [Megamonas hypermegale]|uniref:glycosyltransferase family 2 protein n=1 Tax=Megamonas hypermegale TaxID=158847 RepID=UPI0026F16DE9|nr:glycosyltransferase family 2 protein [Megamonas hypermegale]